MGKNIKRVVADVFLLHIGLKICNDSAAGVWTGVGVKSLSFEGD